MGTSRCYGSDVKDLCRCDGLERNEGEAKG